MTALDLISSALRLIGVLADAEQPDAAMGQIGLGVLNDMIDSWNADRQAIYTISSNDFPLVLGQQTYTLGPGGDFDIPRPARIEGMSSILLNDPSNPVEVPMSMFSVEQWQTEVPVKIVTGNFPQICYDDGNFPLRNLNFWPIPTLQQNSVRIYGWQALPAETLFSDITFPPGYGEALKYNLAGRLAPEYSVQPSPIVVTLAVQSYARVKTMNAPDLSLRSDLSPYPAGYNYKADLFGIPW